MKKTIFTMLVAISTSMVFSQSETPTSPSAVNRVEIKTENLTPITYNSQEELNTFALPRIIEIKNQLAKEGLSDEARISLTELLWRFENAIVIEQK